MNLAQQSSFFLVGNIPRAFRSSDLRGFFSNFAEKRGFTCFHYRHRPEQPFTANGQQEEATDLDEGGQDDRQSLGENTPSKAHHSPQSQAVETAPSTTSLVPGARNSDASATSLVPGARNTDSGREGDVPILKQRHGGTLEDGRGEGRRGEGTGAVVSDALEVARTCCCVVAVAKGTEREFLTLYRNKHWSLADGELLRRRVRISRLCVERGTEGHGERGRPFTSSDPAASTSGSKSLPWAELSQLPELSPPAVMPQGNVGTPLATFMSLIRSCKLPPHVIKKLRLQFPKARSQRRYGAVGMDYVLQGLERGPASSGGGVEEATGDGGLSGCGGEWVGPSQREGSPVPPARCSGGGGGLSGERDTDTSSEEGEEEIIPSDDDHDAEEWERFEALHEDVDKQGRTSERLFEEELEVVWDKGSSGLVFYTDASYWDQQDGDFDEKCSKEDDWDVDMGVYYDPGDGDMDARDMRDMEHERRLRDGKEDAPWRGVAGFEQHTKGFGSRLLKRSGWTEGRGVGRAQTGISEPVELEGQHPRSKRGLGYRGEKLNRHFPHAKRPKATRDIIISTVYDRQDEEEATVLRSAPPTTIKYRPPPVKFRGGGTLRPSVPPMPAPGADTPAGTSP